jgi:subtilisin family serine protease
VFSAGNGGPSAATSFSPANYPEAFAVGAVNGADSVLSFSSRGPSTCGGRSRVFPDLVAPGLNIRTSDRYGPPFWTTASGTSMAAPHVAGALALLLSGRAGLAAADQEAALRGGALDLGVVGPDDTYGNGRLAALASWELLGPPTDPPTDPPADTVGPATNAVAVTPDPTNLAPAATVRASADDSESGGSAITAAEAFVDQPGADGTGIPLSLAAQGAASTDVSGALPGGYADGAHPVYVHARDAAGAWGPLATGSFVVDRAPPTLTGAAVSPTPTGGTAVVSVTATAEDPGGVGAAEATESGARVPVFDGALAATDGAFGGSTEAVAASIDTTGWSAGQHLLKLRARDLAGNWSPWTATTLVVAPSDGLFADGFETGATARWSGTSGGSRLAVTTSDAPVGSAALSATISGNTPSYVQDDSAAAESGYRARFWIDPQATRTSSSGHDILVGRNGGSTIVFRVQYRRTSAGITQLRAGARRSGGETWTAWTTIAAGPHAVELGWVAAASESVQLLVDGVVRGTATGLSNPTMRLEQVRVGPSGGLGSSTVGTEIYDAFASSRGTALRP